MPQPDDPHRHQPVHRRGADEGAAKLALVMLHGRGSNGADMLGLAQYLARPGVACLAPDAFAHTWYPYSFLAPIQRNEPFLSSALGFIGGIVAGLEDEGLSSDRVMLLGFSQGACLASEFVARHPKRYAGLCALSGGLIGETPSLGLYGAGLGGTPAFLGCSDVDPHIPVTRVKESATLLRSFGAAVTERIYPGMGHTVNEDEIGFVGALIDRLLAG